MDRSGEQMILDDIRIRIMQEALDCADRGETEAYNSIKVMCSDVLQMVERLVEAEQEKNHCHTRYYDQEGKERIRIDDGTGNISIGDWP
jgi:hypothetical protein